MREEYLILRIQELNATPNTLLNAKYFEDGEEVESIIQIEFRPGTKIPAIGDGRVGCRMFMDERADFTMPKVGGIKISDIIEINNAN